MVDELADECFMPLTVGGGVRSVEDVRRLLQVGADKVSLNTAAVSSPSLIEEIAREFGSQCVVVSIDARRATGSGYEIAVQSGTRPVALNPVEFARLMERSGAGELLLTAIDRDGTMDGYDTELIASVARAVSIPVIASGGAGCYHHMFEALNSGASAVAAASIFHFTEQTPLGAKRYLAEQGIPVRINA
jgi:cyclase